MFNDLANIFDNFLSNIISNQWSYIFIGLLIFVILIYILCNLIRR